MGWQVFTAIGELKTFSTGGGGGGGAPTTAKYITQTPDAGLSAEQALSALATGLLKNTTATGVLSIATPDVDYYATAEAIQDAVAAFVVAGANIGITYNDPSNTLTFAVTGLTSANLSDFAEAVDDRTAALLVAGSNIAITYNDPSNTLTIAFTGSLATTVLTGVLQAAQFPALTGDITTSSGSLATTLATVNANVGSFNIANITVNAKGLITAASAAPTTGSGNVVLASSPTLSTPTLTSPVINTGISGSAIDNDPTLAANSTTLVATQQATKAYVDAVASGLSPKASARLATTAALPSNTYANGSSGVGATLTATATGVLTVDGQTVALNDRILVKDEASQLKNGIYKCTTAGAVGVAYVLTRATDADVSSDIWGAFVFIEAGTTNASAGFVNANATAPTMGSTAITFTQFSGAGQIVAGTGLTKTGNTLAIDAAVVDTLTGANTLTNKTLTSPTINTPVISGGSIDNTPIGTTTRASGFFSALREYIGGFAAIFTHANSADRTYTLPDFNGTLSTLAGTETLTNKTLTSPVVSGGSIDNTPIGTTTRASGFFSALREYIGGFAAIFTHANTADRTYTLPDFNGTLSTLAGTETLTNKTLTTPTIGSMVNANHTHQNAAGGGTLDGAAIAAGTVAAARLGVMTGSNGVSAGASGAVPQPAIADNVNFLRGDGTWQLPAGGGGGAPTTAKYIVQTADAGLSAEQALDALGTGLVKNTTGTGVLSIASPGYDYPGVYEISQKDLLVVDYASTANIGSHTGANGPGGTGIGATLTSTLTSALSVDGQTVPLNARVLLKDQTSALQNGIWVLTTLNVPGVSGYVLTRAGDYCTPYKCYRNMVRVQQGNTLSNTIWENTNSSPPTVGSTSITFVQIPSVQGINNLPLFGIGTPGAGDRMRVGLWDQDWASRPQILQPAVWRTKPSIWLPGGNSATAPGIVGCLPMTAVGTATARNIATTNILTRQRRLGYVTTAATAGLLCGHYQPSAQYTTGDGAGIGGFMLAYSFCVTDAAAVAGARSFIGISSRTAAPVNVDPATIVNCMGMAQISGDNTQWYLVYGGSAAQTAIAMGTGLGAPTLVNTVFELVITALPFQNGVMAVQVTNLSSGATYYNVITPGTPGTQTPLSTVLLAPTAWRCNNATALACSIDICSMYLENLG